eukprot:817031-Pyramimonas_sp.AAC.1
MRVSSDTLGICTASASALAPSEEIALSVQHNPPKDCVLRCQIRRTTLQFPNYNPDLPTLPRGQLPSLGRLRGRRKKGCSPSALTRRRRIAWWISRRTFLHACNTDMCTGPSSPPFGGNTCLLARFATYLQG